MYVRNVDRQFGSLAIIVLGVCCPKQLASVACLLKSIFRMPRAWVRNLTIWIVDAHGDGKRFVVRAEEKLTAFVELQRAIHKFAVALMS